MSWINFAANGWGGAGCRLTCTATRRAAMRPRVVSGDHTQSSPTVWTDFVDETTPTARAVALTHLIETALSSSF
jgi:hypothetical protein